MLRALRIANLVVLAMAAGCGSGSQGSPDADVEPPPDAPPASEPWQALDAGGLHTCGISHDGTLWCWGDNQYGELGSSHAGPSSTTPRQVGNDADWASLSVGGAHTCALKLDGSLWCWGDDSAGQVGIGALPEDSPMTVAVPTRVGTANDWERVSAGSTFTCATKRDHSAWCWGSNWGGELGISPYTTYAAWEPIQLGEFAGWARVDASLTGSAACGIMTDGSLWCWGYDPTNAVDEHLERPRSKNADLDWADVSFGVDHGCARKTNNTLWCWGEGYAGQLGTGNSEAAYFDLVQVPGDDWTQVEAGYARTCATKGDHTAWCWGDNSTQQIESAELYAYSPVQIGGAEWESISAGGSHTCGRKLDRSAWCWGFNFSGQLGIGIGGVHDAPAIVPSLSGVTQLGAGPITTHAIDADGTLWRWGYVRPSMSYPTAIDQAPTRLPGETRWRTAVGGGYIQCAIDTGDSLWCWGSWYVGDGTNNSSETPIQIGASGAWSQIEGRAYHACAIDQDHSLWCWGPNWNGELGDGTATERLAPVRVGATGEWAQVTTANQLSCGRKLDGTIWCWGYFLRADSTWTSQNTPLRIGTGSDWIDVAAGTGFVCGRKVDHSLWCWGQNDAGELATGDVTHMPTPHRVGDDLDWASLALGTGHGCAVKLDGSAWCWGTLPNRSAQLSPARVDDRSDWTQLAHGDGHVCGRHADGQISCWGDNGSAQLGFDDLWRTTPQPIAGPSAARARSGR